MYNTLIILLHRPALALMDTMNSDVVQQNVKVFFNSSAEKCLNAVDKVTEIVNTIKNDTLLISPFMTYLTYTVATIVVNNAFFAKPEEAKKARSALTEHFALLQVSFIPFFFFLVFYLFIVWAAKNIGYPLYQIINFR